MNLARKGGHRKEAGKGGRRKETGKGGHRKDTGKEGALGKRQEKEGAGKRQGNEGARKRHCLLEAGNWKRWSQERGRKRSSAEQNQHRQSDFPAPLSLQKSKKQSEPATVYCVRVFQFSRH